MLPILTKQPSEPFPSAQAARWLMKRSVGVLLVFLTGCSTAPLADFLDFVKPGRVSPDKTAPYGGVCAPHPGGGAAAGAVPPGSPPPAATPFGVPPPPAPIGTPVPPPPAPVGTPLPPPPAPSGVVPAPVPAQRLTSETGPVLATPASTPTTPAPTQWRRLEEGKEPAAR